jgi:hypothetical protein
MLGVYLYVKFRALGITWGTLTVCKSFGFDGRQVTGGDDWQEAVPSDARVLWNGRGVTLKIWPL